MKDGKEIYTGYTDVPSYIGYNYNTMKKRTNKTKLSYVGIAPTETPDTSTGGGGGSGAL
jgi:hypothetical protein